MIVTLEAWRRVLSRDMFTNAAGLHQFSSLTIGTYDLRVESPKFALLEIRGLLLEAGNTQARDSAQARL